jgi:hypothetical protein
MPIGPSWLTDESEDYTVPIKVREEEKRDLAKNIRTRRVLKDLEDDPIWQEIRKGIGPTAGVTRYLTKEGIPDVVRRRLGTERFLTDAINLGIKHLDEAAYRFALKYPRIAAHIVPKRMGIFKSSFAKGEAMLFPSKKLHPITRDVEFSKDVDSFQDALETVLHEGQHVAHDLALGSRGRKIYNAVSKIYPYTIRPTENVINETVARKLGKMGSAKRVEPLISRLRDDVYRNIDNPRFDPLTEAMSEAGYIDPRLLRDFRQLNSLGGTRMQQLNYRRLLSKNFSLDKIRKAYDAGQINLLMRMNLEKLLKSRTK